MTSLSNNILATLPINHGSQEAYDHEIRISLCFSASQTKPSSSKPWGFIQLNNNVLHRNTRVYLFAILGRFPCQALAIQLKTLSTKVAKTMFEPFINYLFEFKKNGVKEIKKYMNALAGVLCQKNELDNFLSRLYAFFRDQASCLAMILKD